MMDNSIVKKTAERLFQANMDKYGFSFSPLGIYRSAFDETGELYNNWESRMTAHRPSAGEYPDLYNGLRSCNSERRINRPIRMMNPPPTVCNNSVEMLKIPGSVRIDEDVIDDFKKIADDAGVSYQELMNLYLRKVKNEELMQRFVQEVKLAHRRKKAA